MPTILLGRLTVALALAAPALALALGDGAFGGRTAGEPASAVDISAMARAEGAAFAGPIPAAPLGAEALALRKSNAAIPLVARGLSPVRPFIITAPLDDAERAVDCLAAAQFYEAGRGGEDQRSVAQVVLNRVRHAAYPNTVCGVVFQGAQLATGCQFTFTCDGAMRRRSPSPQAWSEARATAREMLYGRVEPLVGQATHYHTDWVSPRWSREMDKIAAVRTHLFFRWRGARGEAGTLNQGYAGHEPGIAMLAGLSAAHAGAAALPGLPQIAANPSAALPPAAAALVASRTSQTAAAPGPPSSLAIAPGKVLPDRIEAPAAGVYLVALPAGAAPASFVRLAEQACAGHGNCRFIGWTDPARRARGLPLSGSSVDAISFTYVWRENSAAGKPQWNCAEFPRDDAAQCLNRGG